MKPQTHFLLFDAAKATEPNLIAATEFNPQVISLYKGRAEENLAPVGPHLFTFPHSKEFSDFIIHSGWGNSWGLALTVNLSHEEVQKHFVKFLLVKTEDGQELYFRFYDPRVLRIFLQTCDEFQLKDFFGPIISFTMEDEDPNFALEFSLAGGKLVSTRITFDQFKSKFGLPMPDAVKEEKKEITGEPIPEITTVADSPVVTEEKKSKWKTF